MPYCYKCGNEVAADSRFCYKCGATLNGAQDTTAGQQTSYAASQNVQVTHVAPQDRPPMPPSNLVWAILTTLFCCLPFGIVSIVYASQVNGFYVGGFYEEAQHSSKRAGQWAMWAAITGCLILIIYLVIVFTVATNAARHNLFSLY